MNDIKVYKELAAIELFEWWILHTEVDIDTIEKILDSAKQFIRIGDTIINRNQIKRVYRKPVDSILNYILSQPPLIQETLKKRELEKFQKVGKKFESVEEVSNYINSHLSSN